MSGYVIGVDGGGTKTHYALFDFDGSLINFMTGGPANHEEYQDGYKGAETELSGSLGKLLGQVGLKADDISAGVFGLAGVDVEKQKREMTRIVASTGIKSVKVFNDAFLGIKAGSRKGYGICVVNGTGTCCTGIDKSGRRLQVSGTGFTFGADGGAWYVGTMVIRKVYDSFFRNGYAAPLMTEMLFEALDIKDEYELVDTVYDKVYTGKVKYSDISKFAFYAARMGEEPAREILRHSGKEIAASAVGAIKKLDFGSENEIDIVMAGSVFLKGEDPLMSDTFKAEIKKSISHKPRFILLKEPPVAGAVLWAMEDAGLALQPGLACKVKNMLLEITNRRVNP